MTEAIKTDVLIVGAGPTGLMMAAQLIRYGIDFVIIDKKEGPTDLSKALVVHARTLEILDQLGLADKAVSNGEIVQNLNLLHEGTVRAKINFGDFGAKLSPFPFVLVHEQRKTEHLLYDHLQQQGKVVAWQTQLDSLTQDETGVKAVIQSVTGEAQSIEARFAIGADGAGSLVRHQLGLNFIGSTYARLFYVADVDMEFEGEAGTLFITFRNDSFMLLVPMAGENRWRLIGNMPEYNGGHEQETTFDEIEAKARFLLQRPLNSSQAHWFSSYRVHTRHAETFSLGRCFLAGDAAHIHTPAGGQGMNTGIQDAYNLAWKLACVLKGNGSDALLETYNRERLANAKKLLKTTDEVFDMAVANQWYMQLLRDTIVPGFAGIVSHIDRVKELVFPTLSQTGINYRESSLSQHTGDKAFDSKAGDRMPYFLIDGASGYRKLYAPSFHLLIFSDGTSSYDALKSRIEAAYGDLLDVIVLPLYPGLVETFGFDKPFMVLLRPDNYIALIDQDISTAKLTDYLSGTIGMTVQQPSTLLQ